LDLLDQAVLDGVIAHRVGGHVEEDEVLLAGGEHALLYQVFGDSFSHVAQLEVELQGIPRLP